MLEPERRIDVFVASTPLQLISCTEAREHYQCEGRESLLIIARPDNKMTESQMAFLVDHLGWQGIETVYLSKDTFYLKLGHVFRRLARRQVNRLFIGNKSSWIHEIFYRGLDWATLVFVDDGLATVRYYHAIHGEGLVSRISPGKRRLLEFFRIRLHRNLPDSVTFFTCFPLASTDHLSVEVHDFPVFRRIFCSSGISRDAMPLVGFLGQPFGGEHRLMQLRVQLEHVIERHPGAKVVYFMHRKERRQELEKALGALPVEFRQVGHPIEVEVALSGVPYEAFYSFASTALFTLKKIFPDTAVFQIDDRAMAAALPYYEEILAMFRGAGVESTRL
ncbi:MULTISPECIES: hypothetical protein [Marinobacter]|uniref:Glycosyltransferase 52 family protein n=1 Tax=Marinobacter profundi TaxID=2666256 RepID=A0A2G1UHP5_9GAMM|nr:MULTISPECIES: hypothetical protein [Marinobacter]MBD3657738.1 hypothetical protein [Marinobacter sp.]PHQ13997.1 hypothetical protein CLH61_15730 [Marinobacter profundi]